MPRFLRFQRSGHLFYVFCRSSGRLDLFPTSEDAKTYLNYFQEARNKYPLKVFNYVFLKEQIHFLIETEEDGHLSKVMEVVTKRYAKYYNRKYKNMGHVFWGRYKSYLVQADKYFLACCQYIDEAAVKAGLVKDSKEYPWGGFQQLAHKKEGYLKVDQHKFYESLGKNDKERAMVYRAVILQSNQVDIDPISQRGVVIGDKEFKEKSKGLVLSLALGGSCRSIPKRSIQKIMSPT